MKNCTQCGQSFSDWVDFCFDDGEVLVQEAGSSVTVEYDLEETDAPLPGNLVFGGVSDVRAVQTKEEPPVLGFTPVSRPVVSPAAKELADAKPPNVSPKANPAPKPKPKPETVPMVQREVVPERSAGVASSSASPDIHDGESGRRSNRTMIIFAGAALTTFVGIAAVGATVFAGAGIYAKKKDLLQTERELAMAAEAPPVVEKEQGVASAQIDGEMPLEQDAETQVPEAVEPVNSVASNAARIAEEEIIPAIDDIPSPVEVSISSEGAAKATQVTPEPIPVQPPSEIVPMRSPNASGSPVKPRPNSVAKLKTPIKRLEAPAPVKAPTTPTKASGDVAAATVPAPIKPPTSPEVPKVQKRTVNVLVLLPGADGELVKLTVDGKAMGSGKRWPVRLQLPEGPHQFIVERDGAKRQHAVTIEYKESMVIMSLK